ncbi:hypothetical protein RB195_001534 [Necator americanus]|uniref:Major facilitator superfamily (MFS) profile domain-containing protein n=1 Tax=Necator americanus TaxID=51031 RepID=A0ABR1DF61_NECAM
MLPPGTYRVDIVILATYQLLQMYSCQQMFLIFLNYAPPVVCFDDHCVKLKDKCYEPCPSCPDECPKNVTKAEREECKKSHEAYFWSPMMEYKQKCLKFTASTSSSEVQFYGALIGNMFMGFLADRFGRRRILMLALIVGIPTLVLSAFLNGIAYFYFGRFILGITIAGTMSVGWAFCAEIVSSKHRFKLRAFTSWTNGRLLMIVVAHIAGTWRLASYLHALAALVPLTIVFLLPESPLWLKRREYYEREREARKKLSSINGLEYEEEAPSKGKSPKQQTARVSFIRALRHKQLRINFLTLATMWFCAGLTTYSIDLNGEDMTKNLWIGQYVNSALASILRVIIGFADARFKWLGRRKLYLGAMGTCTLASIALLIELIIGVKGTLLYFVTYLTAYNAVAVSWEPNYMGAAELIPTEVRATSTALLNVISRVANIFAARSVSLLKGVNEPAIMVVVLASNMLCFTVAGIFLKETKGVSLDQVEQMLKEEKPQPPSVKEGSKSERGSKESKESVPSKSGSKESAEAKKEDTGTGSKESEVRSDERQRSAEKTPEGSKGSAEGSKGSAEKKPDKGSKEDEKNDAGNAEQPDEEK